MTIPMDETCPGCFNPPEQDATACPICKYQPNVDREQALLPVRTRLEDYVIGERLGQGTFGITYRGFDSKLHMKVAIKECYPSDYVRRSVEGNRKTVELKGDGDQEKKENERDFNYVLNVFLREARTLAQVDHRHVVRVLKHIEMHNTAYMVMNFYEGMDLRKYLRDQPGQRLPWRQAVAWLLPMLDGLQAVHQKNFMHLDIKPANLHLTSENQLILLDFGAARRVTGSQAFSNLMSTDGYAPWEQYIWGLERLGWYTDVYAAAATLYVMLTAQNLPKSVYRRECIRSRKLDPLKPARDLVPSLPPALDEVLGRALAIEPEQRLQSVVEFKQQLEEAVLAEENKREEKQEEARTKSQPLGGLKWPTKLNLRAAVIAGMVGVLAWGGWWIGFGRSSDPPHPKAKLVTVAPPVATTPPSVETPPTVETPPAGTTPPAVETTPPAGTTPPAVETTPPAVETPPVAVTPPAVETPSVTPSSTVAVPSAAEVPPAVETPPPVVKTPPVVEPVATATAPPTSDDTARQKRLDRQLAKVKELLYARKFREAWRVLENAKALDRDGQVEVFRQQQTADLNGAALAFLGRGQRRLAKRVMDDLGQWDSQSPEYRALRARLTGKQ